VLSGEATNTNFIVFGLTRLGFEPTIHRTQRKNVNNDTTDTVHYRKKEEYLINLNKGDDLKFYNILIYCAKKIIEGLLREYSALLQHILASVKNIIHLSQKPPPPPKF
jgi:hypothetical protein